MINGLWEIYLPGKIPFLGYGNIVDGYCRRFPGLEYSTKRKNSRNCSQEQRLSHLLAPNIHSQSHITSLNPIRPQNGPDPWETSALRSFEKGSKEVSSLDKVAGEEHMRVMRPFITEKACLKCHKGTRKGTSVEESAFRIVADFTYDWEYWRKPDGSFVYISPSCERITGYIREEFMQDPDLFLRIIHPDDRRRVSEHVCEDQSNCQLCEMEFCIIPRD